ncbi:type II toxin-antitoxin system VapC family toxin [Gloeobacter morelensis]|uniref:Type II toxin-antitoxin system VapC family toxin n=1 Tax=Gloeobacter morelensis MG652769 TaxID=2781736 RepID=A0ABY3PHE8_9CYAN|nr:type II toxin-antitoxin system VapC family toxin [Gloeobacter morelensis]UFP93036.1 type II toxin-antitoxin system VapC family toxin [Gloeobacter morelensis MG652769]
MKYLLDTCAFLWVVNGDSQLPEKCKTIFEDGDNDFYLSIVSIWEISIKTSIGKLELPKSPEIWIPEQIKENEIEVLTISVEHATRIFQLEHHHRDPFDRMIVCQSIVENMPILTPDLAIAEYNVETVWR